MTVSPLDSAIYGELFSDLETAALFSDEAQLRAMLQFEVGLARAEGKLGVIPTEAAKQIGDLAEKADIDPATLAEGTASAGVPVPALVAALRKALTAADAEEAASYVHWGATSQDVIDTGLILRLRRALEILESRLESLTGSLAGMADAHRETVMAGRTRSQQAVPTSFGLKVAGWLAPLIRSKSRLDELRPRLLLLSFGGAAGTLAPLGAQGKAVAASLAKELELDVPPMPWHSQRDGIAELASWLSLVTGCLGKMGQDIVLLAQSEVGEVSEGSGPGAGGSSTMPQKSNPVSSELLVTIARMNAGLLANLHQAIPQEQERGGSGWLLEWLVLPQMIVLTGCALRHADTLAQNLEVDADRMRTNLDQSSGLLLAEAASFALARHMPRPAAQAMVKAACSDAMASGRHLIDVLAERSEAPLDWDALREPRNYLGSANDFIDQVLAAKSKRR